MKFINVVRSVSKGLDDNGNVVDVDVIVPDEMLPTDSLRNVYDASNNRYIVYEKGDQLE